MPRNEPGKAQKGQQIIVYCPVAACPVGPTPGDDRVEGA